MTKSDLKEAQDVLDLLAAHGAPRMKAVPLKEDDEPARNRTLRHAVDVLMRDAVRLCDRLDRVAYDYSLDDVRQYLKNRNGVAWAGNAALRLRDVIAHDVKRSRHHHGRVAPWREVALRRADALVEHLLLCTALFNGGKEVRESMADIKSLWSHNAD